MPLQKKHNNNNKYDKRILLPTVISNIAVGRGFAL